MPGKPPQPGSIAFDRLKSDARRRQFAHPWRCLWQLRFGAYAIVALLLLEVLDGVVCDMVPPVALDAGCPSTGPWLAWMAIGVMVASAIACAYQGWHDFNRGKRRQRRERGGF